MCRVNVPCKSERASRTEMASHDVGIGDFVLLDEITVERVVENLRIRCVPSTPPEYRYDSAL